MNVRHSGDSIRRDNGNTHVIYVPFNAAGLRSGVARMPQAVHDAGVEQLLRDVASSTWISIGTLQRTRGPSALLAEKALTAMITDTADCLRRVWAEGTIPMVIAGDCPVLLAPLIAGHDHGGAGLVFIDGHEDAWEPHASTTGEASDSEIGLALGHYPGPDALTGLPCLQPEHLLILGPRDHDEIAAAGQPSIQDRVLHYRSGEQLAGASDYADIPALVAASAAEAPAGWWCHIDLDVLSTAELPAVDYPQPGGLTWDQLEQLTAACLSVPGCLGASVVIYNPDLDNGHAATRIAEFLGFLRSHFSPARKR